MDCCTSSGSGGQHTAGHQSNDASSLSGAAKNATRFLLPALGMVAVALVIQTFQLIGLQRQIKSAAAAPAASAPASAAAPLPSSLQNLPNMVGGC